MALAHMKPGDPLLAEVEEHILRKSPTLVSLCEVLRADTSYTTAMKFAQTGKTFRGHILLMKSGNQKLFMVLVVEGDKGGLIRLELDGEEPTDSSGSAVVTTKGELKPFQIQPVAVSVRRGACTASRKVAWETVFDSDTAPGYLDKLKTALELKTASPFHGARGLPTDTPVPGRSGAADAATADYTPAKFDLDDEEREHVAAMTSRAAAKPMVTTCGEDEDDEDDPQFQMSRLCDLLSPDGAALAAAGFAKCTSPEAQADYVTLLLQVFEDGCTQGQKEGGGTEGQSYSSVKAGRPVGDRLEDHQWRPSDADVQDYKAWHAKLRRSTIRLTKLVGHLHEMYVEIPHHDRSAKLPPVEREHLKTYQLLMETAVNQPLTASETQQARMCLASLVSWERGAMAGWTATAVSRLRSSLQGMGEADEVSKAVTSVVAELKATSFKGGVTHGGGASASGGEGRPSKARFDKGQLNLIKKMIETASKKK